MKHLSSGVFNGEKLPKVDSFYMLRHNYKDMDLVNMMNKSIFRTDTVNITNIILILYHSQFHSH